MGTGTKVNAVIVETGTATVTAVEIVTETESGESEAKTVAADQAEIGSRGIKMSTETI